MRHTPQHAKPTARVEIPGAFVAEYDKGEIIRWTFSPYASDFRFSGPAAFLDEDDESMSDSLDVDDTDGPFWKTVQAELACGHPLEVEWTE